MGLGSTIEVSGIGLPLVIVHANPFDRCLRIFQAAHFAGTFRVVNIELRDYGYSDKPTSETRII